MGLRRRESTDEATVIDLREAAAARERHPVWGQPNRCPDCGRSSYLEYIDIRRRVQEQRCRGCGLRFETPDPTTVTQSEA